MKRLFCVLVLFVFVFQAGICFSQPEEKKEATLEQVSFVSSLLYEIANFPEGPEQYFSSKAIDHPDAGIRLHQPSWSGNDSLQAVILGYLDSNFIDDLFLKLKKKLIGFLFKKEFLEQVFEEIDPKKIDFEALLVCRYREDDEEKSVLVTADLLRNEKGRLLKHSHYYWYSFAEDSLENKKSTLWKQAFRLGPYYTEIGHNLLGAYLKEEK